MSHDDAEDEAISSVGQRLAGRYEVQALLGIGGMGAVYRAHDRELEEVIALKVIRRELVRDQIMLERFRREVKLARRVTHRNVARVFDIGEDGASRFLTMELVDGEGLDGHLSRLRPGRSAVPFILDVASQVCSGLVAAHQAGIVHRDLKPANILVEPGGRVVVTDFGVAAPLAAATDLDAMKLTEGRGLIVGTPAYMAPEQVEGADVDHRADLYALGVIVFEAVAGRPPFRGPSPLVVAAARLHDDAPRLAAVSPDVPPELDELVARCMARSPGERFSSAADLQQALAAVPQGSVSESTLPPTASAASLSDAPTVSIPMVSPLPASPSAVLGPRAKTVAVLPFKNLGGAEDNALAQGLTEDLRDSLSMSSGLRVCAGSAVTAHLGETVDLSRLVRALDVQVCVEGSFRRMADQVRVTVRLVHAADGLQVWAERFIRSSTEVLAISDDAAAAIRRALSEGEQPVERHEPMPAEAMELFLKARSEYQRPWAPGVEVAVNLFQSAQKLAPNNSDIAAGLASAMARRWFAHGEGGDEAREAVARAIALAPGSIEARLAQATVSFQAADHDAAMSDTMAVLERAPGLAEAHVLVGRMLAEAGARGDAVQSLQVALMLDPLQEFALRDLSRLYALEGQWDRSFEALDVTGPIPSGSRSARLVAKARLAFWRRDLEQMELLADELSRADPPQEQAVVTASVAMTGPAAIGQVLREVARVGRPPEWLPAMMAFSAPSDNPRRSGFMAQLYAELCGYVGDDDDCLVQVERANDSGIIDKHWMDRCPLITQLHGNERFEVARAAVAARANAVVDVFRSSRRRSAS